MLRTSDSKKVFISLSLLLNSTFVVYLCPFFAVGSHFLLYSKNFFVFFLAAYLVKK